MVFPRELVISCCHLATEIGKNVLPVKFFVHKYPSIFSGVNIDCLNEEFFNYQMLSSDVILKAVKESVSLRAYTIHIMLMYFGDIPGD